MDEQPRKRLTSIEEYWAQPGDELATCGLLAVIVVGWVVGGIVLRILM